MVGGVGADTRRKARLNDCGHLVGWPVVLVPGYGPACLLVSGGVWLLNAGRPRTVWCGASTCLCVVRRCPTLPHPLECSTIGAVGLSFRVRNGTGRFPHAMTTVTHSPSLVCVGGLLGALGATVFYYTGSWCAVPAGFLVGVVTQRGFLCVLVSKRFVVWEPHSEREHANIIRDVWCKLSAY